MDEVCGKGALKVGYSLPYFNQLVYVSRRKHCPKGKAIHWDSFIPCLIGEIEMIV